MDTEPRRDPQSTRIRDRALRTRQQWPYFSALLDNYLAAIRAEKRPAVVRVYAKEAGALASRMRAMYSPLPDGGRAPGYR